MNMWNLKEKIEDFSAKCHFTFQYEIKPSTYTTYVFQRKLLCIILEKLYEDKQIDEKGNYNVFRKIPKEIDWYDVNSLEECYKKWIYKIMISCGWKIQKYEVSTTEDMTSCDRKDSFLNAGIGNDIIDHLSKHARFTDFQQSLYDGEQNISFFLFELPELNDLLDERSPLSVDEKKLLYDEAIKIDCFLASRQNSGFYWHNNRLIHLMPIISKEIDLKIELPFYAVLLKKKLEIIKKDYYL